MVRDLSGLACQLNWSAQHLREVYSQESESPKFFADVDLDAAHLIRVDQSVVTEKMVLCFAKTSAETKDGTVLGNADVNTIIASIQHEDSAGHEPECASI